MCAEARAMDRGGEHALAYALLALLLMLCLRSCLCSARALAPASAHMECALLPGPPFAAARGRRKGRVAGTRRMRVRSQSAHGCAVCEPRSSRAYLEGRMPGR